MHRVDVGSLAFDVIVSRIVNVHVGHASGSLQMEESLSIFRVWKTKKKKKDSVRKRERGNQR